MPPLFIFAAVTGTACWLCVAGILYFLFHPAVPKRISGLTIQGLVPAKQKALAKLLSEKIHQWIQLHKISLEQEISSPERMEKLLPEIENHIDHFLKVKLPESMPMIAMLIGDKTIHQVKAVFVNEIKTLFPQILVQYTDQMIADGKLQNFLFEQLASATATASIVAFTKGCRPYFLRLQATGFAFGCIFGLLAGLCCL